MRIDKAPMPLTPVTDPNRAAADLRKAAEGFEAIFLNTFLKAAREASLGEDIMGGQGVNSARDMYETEVTRLAAGRAGLGIADAVERQFRGYVAPKE
jgi:peptidoglycan hydrolase FlgJ